MSEPLLDPSVMSARSILVHEPNASYTVTVPAHTEEDAWAFLLDGVDSGVGAVGAHNTYLGNSLMKIRSLYYADLVKVEGRINARELQLGAQLNNPAARLEFTRWATSQRTKTARLWRLPIGPGHVIGAEIRDWKEYGPGGRSLENLLKRAANPSEKAIEKGAKPLIGEAALKKILGTVNKPNAKVTADALKLARTLRGGSVLLFVPGLALSAYSVWSAPEGQRVMALQTEAVSWAGGFVAANLAIGVAMFFTGGVALILVGVVAGVAGSLAAEYVFSMKENSPVIQQMRRGEIGQLRAYHELPRAYRLR